MCKEKGGDESEHTRLLTFGKISDRRMRELEPGSLIEIIVLDVSLLRKLVLLNLELQNSSYGLSTKTGS